jgi:O-acetyl-ADP-ribose deacetylase
MTFDCKESLKRCIDNILLKASQMEDVKSLSIPAMSIGSYGFERDACADVMINAIVNWLHKNGKSSKIESVRFCDWDEVTVKSFRDKLHQLFK